MRWEGISKKIDEKIKVGAKVPTTDGGTRTVTKLYGDQIQMLVGVKTQSKKYITKEMLQYAFNIIISGKPFTSAGFKSKFPREYKQGPCVFSMTGGILVSMGVAKCISNPFGRGFAYISVNKK